MCFFRKYFRFQTFQSPVDTAERRENFIEHWHTASAAALEGLLLRT
jgi:hypothetical protein